MRKRSIVECVNDQFTEKDMNYVKSVPVKGGLYMVRARPIDYATVGAEPGILLEEIVNPHKWFKIGDHKYLLEPRFKASRFREMIPSFEITEKFQEAGNLDQSTGNC